MVNIKVLLGDNFDQGIISTNINLKNFHLENLNYPLLVITIL